MTNAKALTISAIMPVYNGRDYLERSLPPLLAMLAHGELLEIVVADDGSTDGSGDYCRERGARVVTTGGALAPDVVAGARAPPRRATSRASKHAATWFGS
jgi:glycosyltransferase involved in cell wall biosynthesis